MNHSKNVGLEGTDIVVNSKMLEQVVTVQLVGVEADWNLLVESVKKKAKVLRF